MPEPVSEIAPVAISPEQLQAFLAQTALFHRCEPVVHQKVAAALTAFSYPAGSEVLSAGVPAEALGFVFEGRVALQVPGVEAPLELLLKGESFGEMSAVEGAAYPYSATAQDATVVAWLAAQDAAFIAQRVPAYSIAVNIRLSGQLQRLARLERPAAPGPAAGPAPGEMAPAEKAAAPAQHGRGAHGPAIPFVELRDYDLQPSVLNLVPGRMVRQHRLVPVRLRDRRLTVAMVSPRDPGALSDLRRAVPGVELDVVAISIDEFNAVVGRLRLDEGRQAGKPRPQGPPAINPDSILWDQAADDREVPTRAGAGDEVIRFVNRIVASALDREASDVHVEPAAQGVRVRFRIQGTLSDWTEPVPATCTPRAVAARLKILAGMDIAEKRLPQDGRIGFSVGKREVDLRVSTIPASRGEKIALRILEGAGSTRPLEQIFLDPDSLQAVRHALDRPYGGILVGGPTGSGKTSTLYSMLHERRMTRPDTHVLMVEDPVEYRMAGAVQVQVNPAVGLGFAQVLRAALRQDPDVIVVGEMRDPDTAHLALESAMTGHLLLSSMHANDCNSVLQRLEAFGCTRAVLAQSLSLILVQRLVRRLCTVCRVLDAPPAALLETLVQRGFVDREAGQKLPRAGGCDACNGTGSSGRVVVLELLVVTEGVRTLLAAGRTLAEVMQQAKAESALLTFQSYGAFLLQQQLIGASEALLTLAE